MSGSKQWEQDGSPGRVFSLKGKRNEEIHGMCRCKETVFTLPCGIHGGRCVNVDASLIPAGSRGYNALITSH